MHVDPSQLLRQLDPAVRPGGVGRERAGREPIENRGFGDLLALVADGTISSGRAVDVASTVDEALSVEERTALAAAADRAEQAGAERAVVLLGERALLLQVPERVVESDLASAGEDLVRVDVVVRVGGENEQQQPIAPPWSAPPPSVAQQFEDDRAS